METERVPVRHRKSPDIKRSGFFACLKLGKRFCMNKTILSLNHKQQEENSMDAEKSYYSNFMELKKERPELAEELAEEMCGGRWEDSPLLVLGSDRTETDGREYGGILCGIDFDSLRKAIADGSEGLSHFRAHGYSGNEMCVVTKSGTAVASEAGYVNF
jgi:hypothetical protein